MPEDHDSPALTIAVPSPAALAALKRALAARADSPALTLTQGAAADGFRLSGGGSAVKIEAPARLGALLDKARNFASSPPAARILDAGPYRLDLIERRWFGPDHGEGVVLTDRETALLEALIRAPGHSFDRHRLLEQVWGYHKDAETHTLETHIYRLRRKIEADAAHPRVLLTEGSSYRLSLL